MKRLIYYIIVIPAIFITAPLYKLIRKIRGRDTKIIYEDIINGFTNYTFPSKITEQIATKRAAVCADCPLAKYSGIVNAFTNGETVKEIKGMYCEQCGCSLSAKLRDPISSCPKGKW